MNIVKRILKVNQGRDPERLAMKFLALRSGPFPFLRGTYVRLAASMLVGLGSLGMPDQQAPYAAAYDAGRFQVAFGG